MGLRCEVGRKPELITLYRDSCPTFPVTFPHRAAFVIDIFERERYGGTSPKMKKLTTGQVGVYARICTDDPSAELRGDEGRYQVDCYGGICAAHGKLQKQQLCGQAPGLESAWL
jgi:hypothetical protein